ncbi:Response regulator protein VraR [Corynebacterium urogenitale]|uniref:Response regulator protein VraR n=1 Tax=Corynebacterium urogenitale TaxID=2487892 RepID=A0A5J6Z8V9_9CORY|nr:response regulator transcription factor [Corynebacterium urogenitale]QFQ03416.1 Response regulator protein VraR [Corynebacterium urogenitale]
MTTRILLVDDDPTILDTFPVYFSTTDDLGVSATVKTGRQALTWLDTNTCDIVLSDVRMPDIDGIELLQHIQDLEHPPLFVAMTAFDTDETMLKCLSLGAVGYIIKGQSPQEIITSIRTTLKGETSLSPGCVSRVIARTVLNHPQLNRTLSLSAEQEKIVICIQKGMTNRQIATEMNYAEITVKKKISHLLREYNFNGRAELAANFTILRDRPPSRHT